MLNSKNTKALSPEEFLSPGSAFRGKPFWAWNCRPDKDLLHRELDALKEMGMGGVHIHSRAGLDIPYLGEKFIELAGDCLQYLKENDMECCLYDEDRWPSGSAGGLVTRDHKYRQRNLVISPSDFKNKDKSDYLSAASAVRSNEFTPLGTLLITQDKDGNLLSSVYTSPDGKETKTVYSEKGIPADAICSSWQITVEVSGDTPWFNNEAYADTLNRAAIQDFIDKTHEKYFSAFGEEFGKTIPSIFTDEPQMSLKEILEDPFEKKPVILPWTDDFNDTFTKKYGFSLLPRISELVWETPDSASEARYLYHRHLVERFSAAFGDLVGSWCKKHNIALTGHMMNEWTLFSQTTAVGEAMRPMKDFTIPGIDMLCDRREYSTVKQAASIAHQMGRAGVMSEIYGVTGWDFDFRGHKVAGDWQAALGVTHRVPHLSWVSMAGEGKRDYPASIGYQSPWYREYHRIEDHFARLNTALTRGKPHIDVAVIHPIESYWIHFGNRLQTSQVRQDLDTVFENVINWLLFGLIDFDFISESMLSEEKVPQTGDKFIMGEMRYRAVIVPSCDVLRQSTFDRLKAFADAGGTVIFLGTVPTMIDCRETDEVQNFTKRCVCIDNTGHDLLSALSDFREIDAISAPADPAPSVVAQRETGCRTNNLLSAIRDDHDGSRWLFLSHAELPEDPDICMTSKLTVTIKGDYRITHYDTMTGSINPVKADYRNGSTILTLFSSPHDSFLFHLIPGKTDAGIEPVYKGNRMDAYIPDPSAFKTAEDNVFLLDYAEYAFDDGEWNSEEELLRIDNIFRERLGLPLRMEALAQPWTRPESSASDHILHLRFRIHSDTDVPNVSLALEQPDLCAINLNGTDISFSDTGYFTDESIRRCAIGQVNKGDNILNIDIRFGEKTNLEWMYFLGHFGVFVSGHQKKIIAYPEKLFYGDITCQGFPFYGGNLDYVTELTTGDGELFIESPSYRGALQTVSIDDGPEMPLIFAPYRRSLGHVDAGTHRITLHLFGNRANSFGPVHNADRTEKWYGPNIWRTTGIRWCREYRLSPFGILTTPRFRLE